ncbi:MAG: hypothetical protein M3542_01560 [Acidobacteriota bacterium]|nr:hypothetical protein [Acidobacteriota bacterium]
MLATVLVGCAFLFVTGATSGRRPASADDATCAEEKIAYELASEELDRAETGDDAGLVADLVREKERTFDRYCACLGTASADSEGVGSRAPLVTAPPRGTPSFVPPRGRPVFTPPAGPPPGRPPATPPRTPHRGRPVFTPPGPPFTPPGPPPFTPPGRVRTPPPPTPTPV